MSNLIVYLLKSLQLKLLFTASTMYLPVDLLLNVEERIHRALFSQLHNTPHME